MNRTSTIIWGSGKEGTGHISTDSGALDNVPYSFHTRYDSGIGTNPEELLGAAFASCFTMKLVFLLCEAGYPPVMTETNSKISFEGGVITHCHITTTARVPGISEEVFEKCANEAKTTCPVSKVLNLSVTLEASLINASSVMNQMHTETNEKLKE